MQKNAFRAAIVLGAVALIIAALFVLIKNRGTPEGTVLEDAKNVPQQANKLQMEYYFAGQFAEAQKLASGMAKEGTENTIAAGIIPHDIRYGQFIAHFFKTVDLKKYTTVVLVGPNHYEQGGSNMITSLADWQTPFGTVPADTAVIQALLEKKYVTTQDEVIQHEHSVAGIIPYIAYEQTGVRVVPIILKYETTSAAIDQLIKDLQELLPEDSLVVAPVDFSHYLTPTQTKENDKVTEAALRTLDDAKILSFGKNFNDYVDSPASIAFLLRWAKRKQAASHEIYAHTNSAELTGDFSSPCTSYFEVGYW